MKPIFVYITAPNKKTAQNIANFLINQKLVACANLFPIQAIYNWQEKLVREKEWVLILKTFNVYYRKIEKEVKKIHPYKTPLIAKINISTNKEFEIWIKKQLP